MSLLFEPLVAAWRRVTDAVHDAGGRIFQQLFHLGRKADPQRLPRGGLPRAPSAIAAKGEFATAHGPRPFPETFYSGGDHGYIDYPSLSPARPLEQV